MTPNPPATNDPGDPLHDKVPVPPEVIEQALREFNEAEVLAAIREIQQTGGRSLDDFYAELEKAAGIRE